MKKPGVPGTFRGPGLVLAVHFQGPRVQCPGASQFFPSLTQHSHPYFCPADRGMGARVQRGIAARSCKAAFPPQRAEVLVEGAASPYTARTTCSFPSKADETTIKTEQQATVWTRFSSTDLGGVSELWHPHSLGFLPTGVTNTATCFQKEAPGLWCL